MLHKKTTPHGVSVCAAARTRRTRAACPHARPDARLLAPAPSTVTTRWRRPTLLKGKRRCVSSCTRPAGCWTNSWTICAACAVRPRCAFLLAVRRGQTLRHQTSRAGGVTTRMNRALALSKDCSHGAVMSLADGVRSARRGAGEWRGHAGGGGPQGAGCGERHRERRPRGSVRRQVDTHGAECRGGASARAKHAASAGQPPRRSLAFCPARLAFAAQHHRTRSVPIPSWRGCLSLQLG